MYGLYNLDKNVFAFCSLYRFDYILTKIFAFDFM